MEIQIMDKPTFNLTLNDSMKNDGFFGFKYDLELNVPDLVTNILCVIILVGVTLRVARHIITSTYREIFFSNGSTHALRRYPVYHSSQDVNDNVVCMWDCAKCCRDETEV